MEADSAGVDIAEADLVPASVAPSVAQGHGHRVGGIVIRLIKQAAPSETRLRDSRQPPGTTWWMNRNPIVSSRPARISHHV
jgi:hypothetical protein